MLPSTITMRACLVALGMYLFLVAHYLIGVVQGGGEHGVAVGEGGVRASLVSSGPSAAEDNYLHGAGAMLVETAIGSNCPSLHSTAIRLANSEKFNLNNISETAIGRGLVAGSCKPSGWEYSLVFPKFDRRGKGWMSEGYKSIMGDGGVPLCGYDWDEKLHHVFTNDPCDLVVDIGANFGLAVLPAVSKNFRVLAFEPIPLNLEVLRTNAWVNGWDVNTIGIVAAGVSESSGSTTIYAPINAEDNSAIGNDASVATRNVGGSAIPIPIQLVSIDEYFDKAHDSTLVNAVRLIKIDVQGHELPVLRGMEKLLSNGARRFVLSVEVDGGLQQAAGHGLKDVEEYMMSLGWNAFCSRDIEIKPGSDCYDVVFIHESRVPEARMK
jgi:FkbM family methyltransferase